MEPRGSIYREWNGWGTQHGVLDMPQDHYSTRDYQPSFDQLPWKGEGANDNA
jgi:hypothetical protein